MSLLNRLTSKGPKRILALSGGGIRGLITLGYLERIELLLRDRFQCPDLTLSDYFDLIGGTSTGAIIAAGLAVGYEVSRIRELYVELGSYVFGKKQWKRWVALYDSDPLRKALERELGGVILGDQEKIKTGLCIVTKRADTSSTWPLFNHPNGKFYNHNRDMKLSDIVRASAAAPIFFQPVIMTDSRGEVGCFVDGGVSMFNNPTMQLFLLATIKGYSFNWPTGEKQLMIVSTGTGTWTQQKTVDIITNGHILDWARDVPAMLMQDACLYNQQILQAISRSPTRWYFDREIGDLRDDLIVPQPLLHYLHYDVRLEETGLEEIGMNPGQRMIKKLREISSSEQRHILLEIGRKSAELQIKPVHFPADFDINHINSIPG